jgi:glycosyltransferase involved in cell wall biosynthesis
MRVSVIIPVFNAGRTLRECLRAVKESAYRVEQCLVVDDGSTDDSASIAKSMGAMALSTEGRFGPAYARNLGARHAHGDLLLFLDSDVAIHSDAIGRIIERFESEEDLDALIGAYDDAPSSQCFVSQFKNLMHAFTHRHGNPRAFSFWCGCGAIKRTVFLKQGGLDESYTKPSIEDIEFGFRMMRTGRTLALDPRIECKHLKVWTFWNLMHTDVLRRGIPWTQLILRTRFLPNDLNLRWSQRISVVLSLLLAALAALLTWQVSLGGAIMPMAAELVGILLSLTLVCNLNWPFYQFLRSRRGWRFALLAAGLHIHYFCYCGISFLIGAGVYAFRSALPSSWEDAFTSTKADVQR